LLSHNSGEIIAPDGKKCNALRNSICWNKIFFQYSLESLVSMIIGQYPFRCIVYIVVLGFVILFCFPSFFCITACQTTQDQYGDSSMKSLKGALNLPPATELRRDPLNWTVRLLKGKNLTDDLQDSEEFQRVLSSGSPGKVAIAFICSYRSLFRLDDPKRELIVKDVKVDDLGMKHVRLEQHYENLPVWPADLNVHLDGDGNVYLVQGRYVPTPKHVDVHPCLNESEAIRRVLNDLRIGDGKRPKYRIKLIIYCGSPSTSKLAYRVYAEVKVGEAWHYVISAKTGAVLEKTSAIQTRDLNENSSTGKIHLR